jgi:transposase-like protein
VEITEQRKTIEQRRGQETKILAAANAFTARHFQTPELAREWLEKTRWPNGPVCSHCGTINHAYKVKKPGWYRCAEKKCRKDFNVTTGTIMERSHIALNKWLIGFYMMSSNGMSAHQLHRALNLGYKSAWFMCHRIREAMRTYSNPWPGPFGDAGKVVEADETNIGPTDEPWRLKKPPVVPYTTSGKFGLANKRAIVELVLHGDNVRAPHIPIADKIKVSGIVKKNITNESLLRADENRRADQHFAAHENVKHSAGEYICDDVHNSADYFFIFRSGLRGLYQHCKEKHLCRYLAEFAFRYNYRADLGYSNNDRTRAAIKGIEGKRLFYRQPR